MKSLQKLREKIKKSKYWLIIPVTSFVVLVALGIGGLSVRAVGQTLPPVALPSGDTVQVNCSGGKVAVAGADTASATLKCLTPPIIQSLTGVSQGATLSGIAYIEAKISGGSSAITEVGFSLQQNGNTVHTWTEKQAPYFYYGDTGGKGNGWDTKKTADGNYTLVVKATNADNMSSTFNVSFSVKNVVVAPTPTTAPKPTATVAPTTPPTGGTKGVCGESMDEWHPPVVTGADGQPCNTGHEHGDAPPAWITAAGYSVKFKGVFNTSDIENTTKHTAMKGFTARFSNVDVYFRVHAASNPGDRIARYHSYEVWARDAAGGVSHWQGWYNSGDPVKDRVPRRTGIETDVRPVILVVDQQSYDQGIRCEQWYGFTAEWSWDFGWTICNSTTLFYPGESLDPYNQATWQRSPDNSLGTTRRLEAAWYSNRPHPTGKFVTTQFGEIVSGMSDARCSGTSTKFGVTYKNVCLEQYIAPTMTQVAFPNNAVQKTFDSRGVKLPN
jgi:hypothetical protein